MADYICVPHDCYKICSNFRVISPESLVHRLKIHQLLGARSKLPDYYFLALDFNYIYSSFTSDECEDLPKQTKKPFIERKYKLNRLPHNYMESNISRAALLELINRIELCRETQDNVGSFYDTLNSEK